MIDLMRLRGVLGALLLLAAVAALAQGKPAHTYGDLVFVNGAVYTGDAARSWASAVVVTGNRITYVGDDATARSQAGSTSRVIDLRQRMLLPAFQDSHSHPAMAPNPATALSLHGLVKREQIFAKIKAYARAHPEKKWIVGDGWDEVAFLPSGQPDRAMLDELVPDRPAYLVNNSGHQAWVNTRALNLAGITAKTRDPANGRIERDARGVATGSLQEESAMNLVAMRIPPATAEEMVTDLTAAQNEMLRFGYTAVIDAMATPEVARAFKTLDERGQLRLRSRLCLPHNPDLDDAQQVQSFIAQRAALAGRYVRADCVKIFLDGAYGSHTVVLLEPYSDEPEKYGKGKLFVEQGRLNRLITQLDAAGFQVHIHAQGDGAVRAGLDAFAEARRSNGVRDNRHTIAHLCLIDAADIARFRQLGVVANFSPIWSRGDPWEAIFAPKLFGPQRSQRIFQTRTLLDAGVQLVWGTDWPVTGVSTLEGLETAITHRYPGGIDPNGKPDTAWNPGERLGLPQAISAYTSAGAYLMHDDATRGTVSAGKVADLVVLNRNLFDTPPLEIHSVPVDMTVMDGNVVFERAGP